LETLQKWRLGWPWKFYAYLEVLLKLYFWSKLNFRVDAHLHTTGVALNTQTTFHYSPIYIPPYFTMYPFSWVKRGAINSEWIIKIGVEVFSWEKVLEMWWDEEWKFEMFGWVKSGGDVMGE
jgi:hypothetical protein